MDEHLIEGWEDVISELDLRDGMATSSCHTNREADDSLLGEGGVKDSIRAVLLV